MTDPGSNLSRFTGKWQDNAETSVHPSATWGNNRSRPLNRWRNRGRTCISLEKSKCGDLQWRQAQQTTCTWTAPPGSWSFSDLFRDQHKVLKMATEQMPNLLAGICAAPVSVMSWLLLESLWAVVLLLAASLPCEEQRWSNNSLSLPCPAAGNSFPPYWANKVSHY